MSILSLKISFRNILGIFIFILWHDHFNSCTSLHRHHKTFHNPWETIPVFFFSVNLSLYFKNILQIDFLKSSLLKSNFLIFKFFMVFIFNGFWTNLYQGIAQGDLLVPLLNFMDWLPNGPIFIYTIFESWNMTHILGYIFYG